MEYNAVRSSTEIIVNIVKKSDPKGVLRCETHNIYADAFLKLIDTLPEVLTKNINDFRNYRISIDTLSNIVFPKLKEMLILAAYISAHSDAFNEEDFFEKIIKTKHPSFLERWKTVRLHLKSLYEMDNFDRKLLKQIAHEIPLYYRECGFTLSDTEKGLYIRVNVPVFC